jgi:phenylacetic acid degradation protein paaN
LSELLTLPKTYLMSLYNKHKALLNKAIEAISDRNFYSPYPEHPKAYDAELNEAGRNTFSSRMNHNFEELGSAADSWVGDEVSPFMQTGIGMKYPQISTEALIENAQAARIWKNISVEDRAGILIESLERVKKRFFELAYATLHTTGQSFMMSFQASGPHANDRALEAIAQGVSELSRYPKSKDWVKNMGKFDLTIKKNWKPIPKGISLVIGCSTFPTWNSVPGLYASLITGNPCIIKPHPKSIYPIAIVAAELRNVLREEGIDPNVVQLAVDTVENPVTKELTEHQAIDIIDYTGGNDFGNYVESLTHKTVFTEKAGVNCVILDSVKDLKPVMQNIAFSACLYSGQMCTAPQNVFIPESGVKTAEGTISFDESCEILKASIAGLVNHPKMGAGTLGAIQNNQTIERIDAMGDFGGTMLLDKLEVENTEFSDARVRSPKLIITDQSNTEAFGNECFGPVLIVVKTSNSAESLNLASSLGESKGALTCLAYTTDGKFQDEIEEAMNNVFVPVSFNFSGAAFVNQHAAFSDLHVTGGNPAGNASFTDPQFINRRFVWVGNRYV